MVCWGFQPGLTLTRPASYVRLDAGNTICGLDAVGTAWCSSLGTEMANSAEVTEIPGPFVQVGPGWRVLLLDASGGVTDLHYNWGGGTEFGYLCEIGSEAYTAVASYGQQSCALPVGGGIECWQENDAGCITGTPADLMYWD